MHRAHALYAKPQVKDESELIARYAPMIERLARRMAARAGIPGLEDDLWSAGALGLVDASHRFEAERGVKFETFAEHRVRGAMLDEMRQLDHLPRRLRARSEEAARARRNLQQTLGREATDAEVANQLKITEGELADVENAAQPPTPLDPELIPGAEGPEPDEVADNARKVRWLTKQVTQLPERLQMILALHYQEGCTYREIAALLKVSEPRVCQLHAEALDLLRTSPGAPSDSAG